MILQDTSSRVYAYSILTSDAALMTSSQRRHDTSITALNHARDLSEGETCPQVLYEVYACTFQLTHIMNN